MVIIKGTTLSAKRFNSTVGNGSMQQDLLGAGAGQKAAMSLSPCVGVRQVSVMTRMSSLMSLRSSPRGSLLFTINKAQVGQLLICCCWWMDGVCATLSTLLAGECTGQTGIGEKRCCTGLSVAPAS